LTRNTCRSVRRPVPARVKWKTKEEGVGTCKPARKHDKGAKKRTVEQRGVELDSLGTIRRKGLNSSREK